MQSEEDIVAFSEFTQIQTAFKQAFYYHEMVLHA